MNWVEEFNQTWQPGQLQQTARDHISSALSGKACIPETNWPNSEYFSQLHVFGPTKWQQSKTSNLK